jgi:hypothetical protein
MDTPGRFTENYHAYLLRLTRTGPDEPWEMVAKDVETGEEYPLADPDALIGFLTVRVPAFAPRRDRQRPR